MKVLVILAVVAVAAAQNPYEYIDDDLLQKVGQIVFQYDQKVAASRSAGGSSQANNNYQQQQVRRVDNVVSGSYQRPEVNVARVPNYASNNANNVNYRREENNYGYVQQQNFRRENNYAPVQQQNFRRENNYAPVQQQVVRRQQRQFNYGQQQQVVQPRVQPQPYVAAAPRAYQEPQVFQKQQQQVKSGFTGYSLSQPEVAERVAEFHFTENRNQNQNQGSFDSVAVEGNKFRYA